MNARGGSKSAKNRETGEILQEASGSYCIFGNQLQIRREQSGISQGELAKAAEVNERTIRYAEKDKTTPATNRRIVQGLNRLRMQNGDPPLKLVGSRGSFNLVEMETSWLVLPARSWARSFHGPGALLTAEFRVVRFHGQRSEKELHQLLTWCRSAERFGIRIYRGEGGIGKTRLALELCHTLADPQERAPWTAGFAETENFGKTTSPWNSLPNLTKPLLIVVDYAGEKRKGWMISQLLQFLEACSTPKVRLLFLERDDHWLDRLHKNRAVREVLLGPLLARSSSGPSHEIAPVATNTQERADSFRRAVQAFNKKLDQKSPCEPSINLSGNLYNRVLFIHTQALLSIYGEAGKGKDSILRHLLAREKNYWSERLSAADLAQNLMPAVESAVREISERDGVENVKEAVRLFKDVTLLRDQTKNVQYAIANLLRECYPRSGQMIAPIQPDFLKSFLISESL